MKKTLLRDDQVLTHEDSKRYLKLTAYEEVFFKLKSHFDQFPPKIESIRADRALGRISAEDVKSLVDIPPKTISAMDGYAVRQADLTSASSSTPARLKVKGSIFPDYGKTSPRLKRAETYYVATGAPLPIRTDTVVRVEQTVEISPEEIMVKTPTSLGKNIAQRGEDVRRGAIVVSKKRVIEPSDVALLIGSGRTHVNVYKTPIVGILSTGNELREFSSSRHASNEKFIVNNYQNLLGGYVQKFGAIFVPLGVCGDDTTVIQKKVLSALKKCDIVLTISGSSVGRRDNVVEALRSILGSIVLFHGVRVAPIRPAGLILVAGKPVVIVPGHAVSALLTFFTIVLPILNALSGLDFRARQAELTATSKGKFANDRGLEAIFLASLKPVQGKYEVIPIGWGSNLLSNLSLSDGYVWLKPNQEILEGDAVTVKLFASGPVAKSTWSAPDN